MCLDEDDSVYAINNKDCLRKYTIIVNHLITNHGE